MAHPQPQTSGPVELKNGDKAPDFSVAVKGGKTLSLADFRGKKLVLYFYPKDDTPGCTKQAEGFRDAFKQFKAQGAEILGISKDSLKKHDAFQEKYGLPFTLGSDENGHMCEDYGVWVEKSMYGKKYMGIERATFLIDEDGTIAQSWRQVKVPGHIEEVYSACEA